MVYHNALIGSIDGKWLGTALEDPKTIQGSQVRLLILLGNDPWLDSVKDHLIHSDSVPQVNCLLKTQDTQDLQLHRRKVVEQVIKLVITIQRLHTLIDGDDQLIGLLDCQLSFGVNNRLHTRLDEL